ncbi:imelysin family protein [Defluviicoccus vanus]|uniref:imelysin family protein n=1 Tax=Defluviicoccus vanus TaxID=111831 RepID=UPI001CBA6A47|nr:imelysin family protein [Defluviicoccus vanus]
MRSGPLPIAVAALGWNRPTFVAALLTAMLATTALAATHGTARAAETDEQAFRDITTRVVAGFATEATSRFRTQATRLGAETTSACADDHPPAEALRGVFRDLAAAWGQLSVARFGPVIEDSRLDKLAFWPDPRGVIRRQIGQMASTLPSGSADAATWIAAQSAAVQGLPAYDIVTFGDAEVRSCRSARVVAANIERLAAAIADGFAEPSRLAMANPKPDSPVYHAYRDSVAEIFRALSTQTELLRVTMIIAPLGNSAAETKPNRLFLHNAPATKSYLLGAVDGLQGVLDAMRLDTVLTGDLRGLPAKARAELQTARQMIEQLPVDLSAHLAEEETWNRLAAIDLALQRFGRVVNVGMAPALGFQAGFNALDGD